MKLLHFIGSVDELHLTVHVFGALGEGSVVPGSIQHGVDAVNQGFHITVDQLGNLLHAFVGKLLDAVPQLLSAIPQLGHAILQGGHGIAEALHAIVQGDSAVIELLSAACQGGAAIQQLGSAVRGRSNAVGVGLQSGIEGVVAVQRSN